MGGAPPLKPVEVPLPGSPSISLIVLSNSGEDANDFPSAASILISGSKELLRDLKRSSSPLKTDRTMIKAAVLKAIPPMERMEMMLMKFAFRLESKYRRAMKNGRFNFR